MVIAVDVEQLEDRVIQQLARSKGAHLQLRIAPPVDGAVCNARQCEDASLTMLPMPVRDINNCCNRRKHASHRKQRMRTCAGRFGSASGCTAILGLVRQQWLAAAFFHCHKCKVCAAAFENVIEPLGSCYPRRLLSGYGADARVAGTRTQQRTGLTSPQ